MVCTNLVHCSDLIILLGLVLALDTGLTHCLAASAPCRWLARALLAGCQLLVLLALLLRGHVGKADGLQGRLVSLIDGRLWREDLNVQLFYDVVWRCLVISILPNIIKKRFEMVVMILEKRWKGYWIWDSSLAYIQNFHDPAKDLTDSTGNIFWIFKATFLYCLHKIHVRFRYCVFILYLLPVLIWNSLSLAFCCCCCHFHFSLFLL